MKTIGGKILTISISISVLLPLAASAGQQLFLQSGTENIQKLKTLQKETILELKNFKNNAPFEIQKIQTQVLSTKNKYRVVQFQKALTTQDRQALTEMGISLVSYIPDDAYIVIANEKQLQTLAQSKIAVQGVIDYVGAMKLQNQISAKNVFDLDRPQLASVRIFKSEDMDLVVQTARDMGAMIQKVGSTEVQIITQGRNLDKLSYLDGVEWISNTKKFEMLTVPAVEKFLSQQQDEIALLQEGAEDKKVFVGDYTDLTGLESGTQIMNLPKAWDRNLNGKDQIIAIADTGLDLGEKEKLSKDFLNFKEGFVWGLGETGWADVVGHGTHVMGSVGGVGAESQKIISGSATGATLIMQSVWSSQEQTLTVPDDLAELFKQAYNQGARIHTNSWGDPASEGAYDNSSAQVDKFVWENPDMIILFAAGNSGVDANKDGRIDPGSVSSPATSKNIISVGASENEVFKGGVQEKAGRLGDPLNGPWSVEPIASGKFSDNRNGIAAFSSRGPTLDQRIKPDIVAPGTNILSNCSHNSMASEMWGKYNNDYCFSGGTSMSTPLTAGVVAIVRQYLMQQKLKPSAALVKGVMLHTAKDLYPGQYGEGGKAQGQELLVRGPNSDQGYGRVDIHKAITQKLLMVDEKVGIVTGESRFYNLPNGLKKVTLVYTDFPGSPSAQSALVNNLDIEVVATVNGVAQSFKSDSLVNNTEQISLDTKLDGPVRLFVRGKNIPMGKNGKQPFALVISTN
jgi:serine protease AprX